MNVATAKPTRSLYQRLRASEGLREWHAKKARPQVRTLGGYSPAAPITHRTCQYIAGEPVIGASQRFCGAPVITGAAWCARHHVWVCIPPFMSAPKEPENVADQRLLSIVERIARLEEEKRGLTADIADIVKEAKSAGYDAKAVRVIAKRRAEDASKRQQREETEQAVELMIAALGDFATSPLGQAAVTRG